LDPGDPGRSVEEFDRHRLFCPKQWRVRTWIEGLESCAKQRLPCCRCALDEKVEIAEAS
jgi:hypothetical protein